MKPEKKACTPIKILPMNFNALMAGRVAGGFKTQTRRADTSGFNVADLADDDRYRVTFRGMEDGCAMFGFGASGGVDITGPKPAYEVGQLLYVREPWYTMLDQNHVKPSDLPDDARVQFLAASDGFEPSRLRPSMFMPKKFARTFLRVTRVRMERLCGISEADAVAEGVEESGIFGERDFTDYQISTANIRAFVDGAIPENERAVASFRSLWESIYGVGSWAANPWVWVVEFERLQMENPWNPMLEWEPMWTREKGAWCAKYFAYWFGGVSCLLTVEDVNFCHAWTWQIGDEVPISGQADSAGQAMKNCFASLCAGLLRGKEAGK